LVRDLQSRPGGGLERAKIAEIGYWAVHLGILSLMAASYFTLNRGYSVDDSFITYRYAFHLKEGLGLVFNVGERYYGTTAAGFAVLVGGVSWISDRVADALAHGTAKPTVQECAVALSAIFLCIICVCLPLIVEARDRFHRWVLCIAASLYVFAGDPFSAVPGHETYAFLGLALLATVLAERRRHLVAGCLLGFSVSFRPDAALLVVILALLGWWRSGQPLTEYSRSSAFRGFAFGLLIVLGLWAAFLALYFGSVVPGTMDAKRAQVAMNYWPKYNLMALVRHFGELGTYNLAIVGGGVSAFLAAILLHRKRGQLSSRKEVFLGVCWAAFGIGNALTYFALGVTFWYWYGIPIVFSAGVVAFIGWNFAVDAAVRAPALPERKALVPLGRIRRLSWVLPACIFIAVSWHARPFVANWYQAAPRDWPHSRAYRETADYLKAAEPEGTAIQMPEPGAFGFYLGPKYKVVDELGLITPGVAKALLKGDYNYAGKTFSAKYLICGWPGMYSECSKQTLHNDFELVGEFDKWFWGPAIGHGARLYRRVAKQ
jgi:hypothetical protein